jgi:hypothetical protein
MYDLENIVEIENLKDLLRYTTEYDIYSYYIGDQFKIGKVMKSPLRKDIHPSFGIFKATISGNLLWKDQATGKTGNVIQFVAELFNLSQDNALQKIAHDVKDNLIKVSKEGERLQESYRKTKTVISIQKKNFTDIDDTFWGQYFITRDILKAHNVYPIQTFWVNDIISNLFYTKDQPLYAYGVFDKYQIYCPHGIKKNKFRTNCSKYDMYGLEQIPALGQLLIITKSNKDVMVLDRLGYCAIAPTGENTPIPLEIMTDLKNRFKRIIILYDNDEAGVKGSKELSKTHELENIHIPFEYYQKFGIKDISDYIKSYKVTKSKQLLKDLLNEKG